MWKILILSPVHTGPAADRYADWLLPGGTAKIDRQRSISAVDSQLKEKSTVGGRLRKKKERGRRKRGKKKEEEEKKKKEEEKYLARAPSPPAGRQRVVAAHGRLFSLRRETKRLPREERDRGDIAPLFAFL
ncbi:hypothetical protein BHM03_00025994 [Ensete ventricosum]|nr:hypothetical protein BHM03_00025994 [Ensete ventricosum]